MRLRRTLLTYACAGLVAAYAAAVLLSGVATARRVGDAWGLPVVGDPRLDDESPFYAKWLVFRSKDVESNFVCSIWYDARTGGTWDGHWPEGDPRPHLPAWAPELDPAHHAMSTGRMHVAIVVESGWPLSAVRASASFDVALPASSPAREIDVEVRGGVLQSPVVNDPFAPWLFHFELIPLRPLAPGLVGNAAMYAIAVAAIVRLCNVVRRAIRRRHGRCAACGYVLASSHASRCPECGRG